MAMRWPLRIATLDLPGEYVTDGFGEAELPLAPGTRSIFAYRAGYVAAAGAFDVAEGESTIEVRLRAGATLAVQQIVSEPLSSQQILERGIDMEDPVNNVVFDFTVALAIGPPLVVPNVELPLAPPPGFEVPE